MCVSFGGDGMGWFAFRKSGMDAVIDRHGIEISDVDKVWDPYRTYLKRLISTMAKDPSKGCSRIHLFINKIVV